MKLYDTFTGEWIDEENTDQIAPPERYKAFVDRNLVLKKLNPTDKEYPKLMMALVDNPERYDIYEGGGYDLVPLIQVLDALSGIKADEIVRNGKRICPNCGAEIKKGVSDV